MGKQAERIGVKLNAELERAVTKLSTQVVRELRDRTPVDTGRTRDNWSDPPAWHIGDGPVHIDNATPDVVRRLNEGHSKQAPALFVEASADSATAKVQAEYAKPIKIE